jgi:TRAP-type transport system periplasmic protein
MRSSEILDWKILSRQGGAVLETFGFWRTIPRSEVETKEVIGGYWHGWFEQQNNCEHGIGGVIMKDVRDVGIKLGIAICCLIFILGLAAKSGAAEYTFKFGYYIQADASFGKANDNWARLVEKLSNGRIKIENYPGGSVAAEQKSVALCKAGTLDFGQATTQNMGQFTDIFQPFDVFYTVPSAEAAMRLFEKTETGRYIDEQLQKTQGLKMLWYIPMVGFRKIWNNERMVKLPSDLKGLKLRSTATVIEQESLKALGANPVPLPYPEIYMALQQKMIHGLHVDTETIIYANQHEVLKYGIDIRAQHALEVTTISTKLWDSLPKDIQQVIIDATNQTYMDRLLPAIRQVKEDEAAIEKKGVKVYHPTDQEMKEWKEAAASVKGKFIKDGLLNAAWYDKIQKELTEIQKDCKLQ